MVIDWMGHSCFKVTVTGGTRILFDPYDSSLGYPPQDFGADIVAISHDHYDHNAANRVKGSFSTVKTQGEHVFGDILLEGVKTWHDAALGRQRGENIAFLLKAEGLTLCHMGDIGCVPSEDVFKKLSGTDILMIPVGGNYTVGAREALEICERIGPNIIIPMHFWTQFTTLKLAQVDEFIEAAGNEYDVSHPGQCRLEIDKAGLKKRPRIVVMECI